MMEKVRQYKQYEIIMYMWYGLTQVFISPFKILLKFYKILLNFSNLLQNLKLAQNQNILFDVT